MSAVCSTKALFRGLRATKKREVRSNKGHIATQAEQTSGPIEEGKELLKACGCIDEIPLLWESAGIVVNMVEEVPACPSLTGWTKTRHGGSRQALLDCTRELCTKIRPPTTRSSPTLKVSTHILKRTWRESALQTECMIFVSAGIVPLTSD